MHILEVFLVAVCACAVSPALSLPHVATTSLPDQFSSPRRERRGTSDGGDTILSGECGVRGPSYETRIAGGEDASVGEFPWHVGVYRYVVNKPRVQDCGGTLLTRSLVITAAHCFWDESTKRLKPKTLYKIAAGKFLRDWDQQEHGLQTRDVEEINIPKRFRGRGSQFQYDIAIVKLATRLDFSDTIKPICMDWSKQHESQQMVPGNNGIAVGWGVTSNDLAAKVLQKVELPFVDFDTCFDALPEHIKNLYTDDKFCSGFSNRSRSVCKGDSGGGLVFNTRNRYFLQGVVSVSFKPWDNNDACYSQLYTGFTNISQYLSWIRSFVNREEGPSTIVTTKAPPKKKSTSEKMCELYSSAVYETVELPSAASAIQMSTCAMSPSGVTTQRLLSQPREFPHMASIGYLRNGEIKWLGMGSLISERFVVTTAVAAIGNRQSGELKWVRLGSVKRSGNNTDQGVIHLEVEEVILHPDYNASAQYNIALLRLKENVTFNGYVRPACLDPYPAILDNSVLTAASWGMTHRSDEIVFDSLLHGDLKIIDTASCNASYHSVTTNSRQLKNGISALTQLCVNTLDMSTDCALLSGSPVMAKLSNPFCMYRIVGIISFGQRACGIGTVPTVATRISAFIPWIENTVWPNEKSARGP